jgi:hypothetical protein
MINAETPIKPATSAPSEPAVHSSVGLERKGIYLTIDFQRISPNDKTGMVDITCEGDEVWVYADIGSHHGAQCNDDATEKRVMAFGAEVSALVKKHFGMVRPILDYNPSERKSKRSNS